MTPSQQELAARYAGLSDTALLRLATERNTLTEEASSILQQALVERGLDLPEVLTDVLPKIHNLPAWVTVERFRDLADAIVARTALEGAGIECFLRDENTVRLDWQISNFIGGMRLQVHTEDQEQAALVLQAHARGEIEAEDALALEPGERCPFCHSADVHRRERGMGLRAAALWLFTLPLPKGASVWHCSQCGRHFPERDLLVTPKG